MRVSRLLWAAAVWLALVTPSWAQSGLFDWASASQLGSYAGIRRANVTVTSPRTMNINCLQIDTFTPGLRFYTTPAGSQPEVVSQTTRQFITTSQTTATPLVAAINAGPWSPYNPAQWNTPLPQNLSGLAVSQGALVSPGDGSPSFLSTTSGAASMAVTSGTTIGGVQTAVSGFGFVLSGGSTIAGDTALHPRTGIGLSQDSRYVYFMTIDGRQTASAGATTQEVGSYLQYFGSYNGINMDGGGSTTMAWWNPTTSASQLLNVPVGNPFTNSGERYNANNIGIYYTATPPAPTTSITQVLSDTFDSPASAGGQPIGGPAALTSTGWVTTGSPTGLPGQEDDPGQPQPNTEGQFAYFQLGNAVGNAATTMRKDTGVAAEASTAYTVTLFNGKRNDFPAITSPFQVQLYAGDPGAGGTGGTLIGTTTVNQTTSDSLGYTVGRFTTGTTAPSGNVYARIAVPANAASGTGYTQLLVDSLAIEKSPGIFNESFDRGGGGNGTGGAYSNVEALANNGWQYTLTTTFGAAPGQESSPATQPTPDSGANWGFLNAFGDGGQKMWIDTGYNIANLGDSYLLQFYTGGKNESTFTFTGTLTASLWAGNPNAGGTLLGSGIGINPAANVAAFNSIEIVNSFAATADLWVQFETGASGNGGFQQALIDSVVVQLVPVPEPSTLALAALGLLALCRRLVPKAVTA